MASDGGGEGVGGGLFQMSLRSFLIWTAFHNLQYQNMSYQNNKNQIKIKLSLSQIAFWIVVQVQNEMKWRH